MLVLIGIGLAAGFITAISPCVLPVLPIIFAGGATGGRRKPFAIIAGLVLSFSAFTLFGVWLLKRLGLPEDLLRDIAIGLLFLVAATLLFPKVEEIVQRPFLRLTRRPGGDLGGGLLLGASLGLVFVPCAGPVLAAITVVGATQDVGARSVVLTRVLRDRRSGPDAPRRVRRPVGDDRAPAARAPHPAGARRRGRADRARDRAQRRPPLPDGDPRLHGGAPEQGRAERPGPARAAEAARKHARAGGELLAAGLRRRRRSSPASRTGSTATRSRSGSSAARSSWSTSGPTRASTACGRCRT